MIEALMDSPFFGIEERGDLQRDVLGHWITYEVCPVCKKTFAVYDRERHAYKIGGKRKMKSRRVCSWSCQRTWEKAEAAKPRAQKGGGRLDWRDSVELALARKTQCLEKIAFYKARQKATSGYTNHKTGQNVRRWEQELEDVEAFLETKGVTE